jgi:hypothetical protein
LQTFTLVVTMGACGLIVFDRVSRARAPAAAAGVDPQAFAELKARVEGEDAARRKLQDLLDAVDAAEKTDRGSSQSTEAFARMAIDRLTGRVAAMKIVPLDRRWIVRVRSIGGAMEARVVRLPDGVREISAEAERLLKAAPQIELRGGDATVPLDDGDLVRQAVGDGEALLFLSATVRANNDVYERQNRHARLFVGLDAAPVLDLEAPFFPDARHDATETVLKSASVTTLVRVTAGAKMALGIDADALAMTADGALDIAVRAGPALRTPAPEAKHE